MAKQSTRTTIDAITCPSCGTAISVTDQLAGPLRAELAAEMRPELERLVRAEHDRELSDLGETVQRLEAENAEMKDQERQLRKDRDQLRRKEADFDLTVAREIDRARKELVAEAEARTRDALGLELKERDETITRMKKDLDAARRRAAQPSSELQGTVQEQALDEILRSAFPDDDIARVPKGRGGADIIHRVRTNAGHAAGTIIWESKRAKHFGRDWIPTLKANARSARADVAVLVTSALPDGQQLADRDGIWIVSLPLAGPIAAMLRAGLLAVARTADAAGRRDGLAGSVYDYLTSGRFRDVVVASLEQLAAELRNHEQEQAAIIRRYEQRRGFIQRQIAQWAALVGDLQGLGAELPTITMLELPAGSVA